MSSAANNPVDRPKNDDAGKNFRPRSPKFWLIILGVYFSMFLVALDRSVIATAIPRITDEFNSIADIGWYGSSYMLTSASFSPSFGRAYKLYSIKWTFLVSLLIFEVGSAVCGAAPSSTAFIIGRAVAGLGGAGIFSGAMMTVVALVPLRKRPIFVSVFGVTFGISSVLGPIIGGSLTDHITWRWCFYINLPISGFTMLVIFLFFNVESAPSTKLGFVGHLKNMDPLGVLFFVPSIVCLILALQWGGTEYAWSAPTIIGLLVTFAALLVAFIVVEVVSPETAMTPARVVLNRSIAGSMVFVFLISGAMMSIIYYLSIWFQVVMDLSAMDAGLRIIPLVSSMVIIGVISAMATQRLGYYVPAMITAPLFCSIGAGLLSTLTPNSSTGHWIGYQVIFGVGLGCGFQTSNLAAQTVLPPSDIPIGMSLMSLMQQIGGSIFLAVDQNLLSTNLVQQLSNVEGLDANIVINTGATGLRRVVPDIVLNTVINAYNYVLTRIFVVAATVSACAMLGALVLEWKSIRGKEESRPGDTGGEKGGDIVNKEVRGME